ncbi:MAG TPA: ferredoxin-type protein NapG [Sedimenticola thiotaurini]|uniref:Ferredoxin-type protein NapG n=1 Tax=Sedimenticola thiotaurini TaxID=1543721 RepID=A0A831RJ99_9GAMM|nr:ferredoxin-type protein NapG [Sedimenticola thiotaurini]
MSEVEKSREKGVNRRKFLVDMAKTACGVGLMGMGLGLYSRAASSLPAQAIRPPGALPEEEFLGACIRCGLCVRDCPYGILKLASPGEEVPTGTPYFTARTGPCEMCEDIPCIPNCPTNALDHELKDINDARMGLAVVIDQETCIAFLGLRCEVCFNICPIRGKAITLDYEHNKRSGKHARFLPVVHSEACTGCGLCEKACILEEAAIKVLPTHLAKGVLGKHYRIGWEEKAKAGHSLVTPDVRHQYNLPEGVQYDLQGKGLIMDSGATDDVPISSNPLDTLNRGLENQ